jgi:hypothetical protein
MRRLSQGTCTPQNSIASGVCTETAAQMQEQTVAEEGRGMVQLPVGAVWRAAVTKGGSAQLHV